ncbi:zonular occludens toxin domain-containing protein [Acinetobacter zhairhuonensis]|uniref:zonular occludens toxin domain-containing protein n=1 Tax=Acinetobacter sp. A7.4 TaxID=2919921 RepID=UPI001F5021AA|nr:zonular occludens toxin domain-containing protein [Acinetobacter sp. A7.4]MCJ8163193.1 zonular occludens toxin domain-containing protein [Acinetobacter sp. A7.4]
MPLYAIVGKMRQGKSYFSVKTINELQETNNKHVVNNFKVFNENQELLEKSGDEDLTQEFHLLCTEQQYESYFVDYVEYNKFVDTYNEENSAKLNKLKPVRQIYTDIKGLKIEFVLPAPDDWRTTPKGSIIFYDEVQDREPYRFVGNVPSRDQMILDIAKIGHTDKDMYLITQDPDNLNKSLRKIVDKLYFVKRPPQNFDCCSVYVFPKWLSDPSAAADSQREPKKYISNEVIGYKQAIYDLYESASSHESIKKKFPKKWVIVGILILIFFGFIVFGFTKIPIFSYFTDAVKMMFGQSSNVQDALKPQMPTSPKPSASATGSPVASNESFQADRDCRKAVNVEKKECVDWFNNLSKNKGSVTTGENGESIVTYDPSKPYETESIQQSISYEVTAKPVFSGCMKKNGKYYAYTQQGTKLNVSQQDCRDLVEYGDRPFNYFAQQQESSQIQPQTTPVEQNQPSLEQIAKFEQAKKEGLI